MTEKNPQTKTVIIELFPRELWERAKAYAHAEIPRRTLKDVVIDLVRQWVTSQDRDFR